MFKQKRYLTHWLKLGLSKKITVVGIVSITITLLTSLIAGIIHVNDVSQTTMINIAEQSNQIVIENINQILTNAEHMTDLVVFSDTIQKQFNLDNRIDQLKSKYTLSTLINNLSKYNKNADSVVLYHRTGWIIASSNTNLSQIDPDELFLIMKSISGNVSGVWSEMHPRTYTVFNQQRNAVSLYKDINSIYSDEQIGIITVDVPERQIYQSYKDEINNDIEIYIIDAEGTIVSAQDNTLIYQPLSSIGTRKNEQTFIDNTGASFIITETPSHSTKTAALPGVWVTVGISLLVEVLTAIVITLIIRHLMKPIDSMIDIMNNPADSIYLNQEAVPTGDDEIDRLVDSFRTMQQRIRILIERIRYEEDQKAKNEIIALQANIKPHFLYNTLESVCALIQMERNEDAMTMLKSIENFYHGTLSQGRHVITLREELDITQQYLQIQKLKYAGTLKYVIDVSEAVMDVLVPKLTLQPLVENAIYHGLKNCADNGMISITETHTDSLVVINVEDNGIGFLVSEINNWTPKKQRNGSYAISNVVSRLKLCLGTQSGLAISSEPGLGTKVAVTIPFPASVKERKK